MRLVVGNSRSTFRIHRTKIFDEPATYQKQIHNIIPLILSSCTYRLLLNSLPQYKISQEANARFRHTPGIMYLYLPVDYYWIVNTMRLDSDIRRKSIVSMLFPVLLRPYRSFLNMVRTRFWSSRGQIVFIHLWKFCYSISSFLKKGTCMSIQ
jgi:hypothetical protein